MYYNTLNETGEALKGSKGQSWKQEELILEWFRLNREGIFTPFEVQEALELKNTPITSIRRAINDLTKAGQLEKTQIQKPGIYGKNNYCWKLFEDTNQLNLI